jgi:hypothetical protein
MQDRGKGTYVRESGEQTKTKPWEQTKTKPAMISCFGGQVAAEPDEATVQTMNRLVQEFQTILDSMDGRDLGPDEQLEILDELSRGHEELDGMFPWRRSRWRATKAALLSIFGRNRGRSKVKPAGEDGGITARHLIRRNNRPAIACVHEKAQTSVTEIFTRVDAILAHNSRPTQNIFKRETNVFVHGDTV